MTPMPAQAPTTALSPYLSLRQAVRPAIVTYTVLASEQERAGALAEEASQLLESTRELLEAVGLVRRSRVMIAETGKRGCSPPTPTQGCCGPRSSATR